MWRRARHQRLDIHATRQGAVHAAARSQAAGDEAITDCRVTRLKQQFGLQRHGDVFGQLSGAVLDIAGVPERRFQPINMQRQVLIAMAIAQNTPLLLLDEPTSALDLGHQIEVFELIRGLAGAGKTVVMVGHDLSSACRYADRLVAMDNGKIIAQGPPGEVVTPELVHRLYGVHCVLLRDPLSGTPIIAGVQRAALQRD